MSGGQQFYGFAAVVIPVLLFGGAVVERWTPKGDGVSRWFAWGVVAAMLFAIIAEVIAIGAAFTGQASAVEGAIVVLAVVGGTIAAAGAVTWPWRSFIGSRYSLIALATILAGVVLTVTTYQAISAAGSGSEGRLTTIERAVLRIANDQDAVTHQLDRIVKIDSDSRTTLRKAVGLLASDLGQARATSTALIRLLQEDDFDRDIRMSSRW